MKTLADTWAQQMAKSERRAFEENYVIKKLTHPTTDHVVVLFTDMSVGASYTLFGEFERLGRRAISCAQLEKMAWYVKDLLEAVRTTWWPLGRRRKVERLEAFLADLMQLTSEIEV